METIYDESGNLKRKQRIRFSIVFLLCLCFLPLMITHGQAGVGNVFGADKYIYTVLSENAPSKTGTVSLIEIQYSTNVVHIPPTIIFNDYTYTVTELGRKLFFGSSVLEAISIPATITKIEDLAFYNCNNLKSIYFKGDAPTIVGDTFNNPSPIILYYHEDKEGWETPWNHSKLVALNSKTVIWSHPQDFTGTEGSQASFTVQTCDDSQMTYQWYKDAVAIEGARGPIYTIEAITSEDMGNYTVNVKGETESQLSDAATLTVIPMLFTDSFDGGEIDKKVWWQDLRGFEYFFYNNPIGTVNTRTGGKINMNYTLVTGNFWGGYSYISKAGYNVSESNPAVFTIERESFFYTGTGARCSFLVYEGVGQKWINISDFYDNGGGYATLTTNAGWSYNLYTGTVEEITTGVGKSLPIFNAAGMDDLENHTVSLVANGKTVSVIVDGLLGAEIPFTTSEDIHFGFGVYARAIGDTVNAQFRRATINYSGRPQITFFPQSQQTTIGESVTFSVKSIGEEFQTFQWQKEGVRSC